MPCTDGGIPYVDRHGDTDYTRARKIEAVLCGVLTSLRNSGENLDTVFDNLDWKEAGVTRAWAENWWEEHQAEDKLRKEREDQAAKRVLLRNQAMEFIRSNLTIEEAATIGIDLTKD